MKQINLRVKDEIAEAFYQFCERNQLRPYDLLGSIVDFYGRGEILTRKAEQQELIPEEALVQFGHIIADIKNYAKANGEFKKALSSLLEPYGVKIEQLGLI